MLQKGKMTNETGLINVRKDSNGAVPERSSHIRADLKIIGNIETSGDLQVDGTVEGDIECRAVTVGEPAQINGSIAADVVRIFGSVTGDTTAASVCLEQTARVVGNVIHESLSIVPGAFVDGHCRRASGAEAPAKVGTQIAEADDDAGARIELPVPVDLGVASDAPKASRHRVPPRSKR